MDTKRVSYVDIAKGLAILCVIVGHTTQLINIRIINKAIFSFHMPLFFILSGWCMREGHRSTGELIKVKAKQLLIPYAAVSVIKYISLLVRQGFSWSVLAKYIVTCIYGNPSKMRADVCIVDVGIIGMQWFMLAMFSAQILYHLLRDFSERFNAPMWMVTLVVTILGLQMSDYVWLPLGISQAMGAMIYIYIGQLIKKSEIFEKKIGKGFAAFPLASLAMWILAIQYGYVRVNANYYYGIFSVVGAVCGTYCIVKLSQGLEGVKGVNSFLRWCGRNSLYILVFHAIDSKAVEYIMNVLEGYFTFPSNLGGALVILARCLIVVVAAYIYVSIKNIRKTIA